MKRCLLLAGVLLLSGCPGDMPNKLDRAAAPRDTGGGDTSPPPGDTLSLTTDAVLPDTGPLPDLTPDVKSPVDLFPHPADKPTSGAGGPCPCKAPLLCIDNKFCRAKCPAPTGGCGVTSTCPKIQSCVPVISLVGVRVCVPGVGPGKACSASKPCYNNYICASVNYNPAACLPICASAGKPCGSSGKGTCLASGACLLCSAP